MHAKLRSSSQNASIPIYTRETNYDKLRRRAEVTGKSIGAIINELIQQMN